MENKFKSGKQLFFKVGKESFAVNVSDLTTYTDEISDELGKEIVLAANTIKGDIVSKEFGAIGNAHALNVLSNTVYAVGSSCGAFTDTGSTVLNQTSVSLCGIQFPNELCLETLQKYFTAYRMSKSFNAEDMGEYTDVLVSSKIESMSIALDKMLWQGATSATAYFSAITGNNTLCNGFLQNGYLNSASTVNVIRTAITISNAYGVLDSVLAAASANAAQLLDEFTVYLSPSDFQTYLTSLRTLNLFRYDSGEAGGIERILHPGSIGMYVQKTNGLQGALSGFLIATKKENIVAVISSEEDINFKMWWSDDYNALRMRAKIKFGTGYRQPELVVRTY